ncbi:formate dehydrogenase subunit alpha [Deinococcus metallilatus]|uniref:Formate dehydrogenase major subunit n=1 Tax=Deinococcus metallilatus TaxID=1211322 RepID=A0ABR6MTV3_9DEIO|nr:formate dehydrogenase subunit alpha [Deinococcus metallilatus]MBB5295353.1 formate dehydrogenase major subunit [Deinococcus metallilatus]GMA16030.1 putative oxidoreductase YjgC [Deinococcus metallilatus]
MRPTDFEVQVNGVPQPAVPGEPLIEVLNRAGLELPQVCYHPQLGPIQTCDTCLVTVNGEIVRACGTPVTAGMSVQTETLAARESRVTAFDKLLGNHLLYCTVCDNNNGNCVVHNTTALLKVEHQFTPYHPKPYPKDESNPFYRYDPDQCILCGRCVEACQNLQVNETLTINWEDPHPRVLWDGGRPINESSCVSCGHCVTVCPCNALMEKTMLGEAGLMTDLPLPMFHSAVDLVKAAEPSIGYGPILQISDTEAAMREGSIKRTKTVCTYCGVGCSFEVWTKERYILKIEPTHGPANGVSTCIKGKFGWDYVNSDKRLTTPLIREGDRFREASWEEATALIARRFSEIKAQHGPDALAFIASSKCTNEEAYLMQKLARGVVGTNNMDNCSRYCQSPATMGLWRTVGYGGDSGSIHDLERAGLVIGIGTNTAESHPVLATRVKRAHKLRGQRLIVADLREQEMAQRADLFIRPNPGTDFVWVTAVAKYILDEGLEDRAFLEKWVNGLDEFRASIAPYTLAYAEEVTGISQDVLKRIAHEIVQADGTCIMWAMGVTQQCSGSETSTAISNLLLVTGNYMRPGAGSYPLRGHNNVQGASDMGAMPNFVGGYQKVDDPAVREKFAAKWGVELPTNAGLDNHEMVHAIYEGTLRAMYLKGEEMGIVDSNANYVDAAFEKLDFFVVQDTFFSYTASFADVVLPASPSLEKDGTFTNTERRIQRLYRALEPLGDSKPDWEIIQLVANALGAGWNYHHPSEIMEEIASLTPLYAGVTYERLEGFKSLQWPVLPDGSDTPLLFTEGFPFPDGKARLYPAEFIPPQEVPDAEYDLHFNNGRMLEHFHEGNMTFKSPGITEKVPGTFVEVSPELARERGLESGRYVRLVSRHGAVRLRVLVTDRVEGKQVYMPMNTPEARQAVNRLTGSHTDPSTHTPAYKDTAVRMEILPEEGENPLPRVNPRYWRPTPQPGVEVERKWRRPDYRFPGDNPNRARIARYDTSESVGGDD